MEFPKFILHLKVNFQYIFINNISNNKMSKILKKLSIITIFFLLVNNRAYTQDFENIPGLSKVKVEQLSNEEIIKIKTQLKEKNLSIEKLESIALSKGMSSSNFALLKKRIENENSNITKDQEIKNETKTVDLSTEMKNNPVAVKSEIFGSEIFSNPSLTFEPNSNMATPLNYILGSGDELQIVIYGVQEFESISTVSKEGKINIPNVGQINVSGMTLEAAIIIIKKTCSKIFSTLKSGQSNISVSLTKIRTIKVTIIGSKKAGNYSVSSLSSVFNSLYLAGGPDENGSYRNIELIRNNKIYKKIDIYKFLVTGDQSDNITLKENDIIRIPVYNCRVKIEGEVKRPGVYELNPGENFNDLLKFCNGFSESAYVSTIKLTQLTDKELKIVDLTKNEFINYVPKSGDILKISKILDRYENRISIKGAVFRPDYYSFTTDLKVTDLIKKADGLKEYAFKETAQITRLKDDYSKEIISINLKKAFEGDTLNDIKLKKEDELIIFSIFDFKDELSVRIEGQIRNPGKYNFLDNLTLYDVIIQAGGFTDNASKNIEISRIIKKDEVLKDQLEISKIIPLNANDIINDKSKNIYLEPNDLIIIRKMPIYEIQQTVTLTGFVEYPGQYTISNKDEKVLDLINRAGGLKPEANPDGIYINRSGYKIPINFSKILKHPKSIENIKTQPGDELVVLKYISSIKIVGSVNLNTEIPYIKGKNIKYYINSAGGYSDRSWKRRIYNLYSNGRTKTTKQFLFFRKYPKVLPGAIINIPQKPVKEKKTIGEFVSTASIATSMVTMVAVISKLFQ